MMRESAGFEAKEWRRATRDRGPKTGDRHTLTLDVPRVSRLPSPVSGFTLVELMLVVIIISVLAAMVVPRLAGRTEQAKFARAQADIAAIGLALDLYQIEVGAYPKTLDELVSREAPSHLSEDVRKRWRGPYLKSGLPKDPWGRAYDYKRESQHGKDYDVFSLGQDGQPGHDDISNWDS